MCSVMLLFPGSVNWPVVLGVAPQLSTGGDAVLIPQLMPLGMDVPDPVPVCNAQLTPVPVGSVSVSVTPVALPDALLVSVTM